jgi:hypothetical protein
MRGFTCVRVPVYNPADLTGAKEVELLADSGELFAPVPLVLLEELPAHHHPSSVLTSTLREDGRKEVAGLGSPWHHRLILPRSLPRETRRA